MTVESTNVVKEIPVREGNVIRVSILKDKGKIVVDARIWYRDDNDGEWKPTKKGLWMIPEVFDGVKAGFDEAARILEA